VGLNIVDINVFVQRVLLFWSLFTFYVFNVFFHF